MTSMTFDDIAQAARQLSEGEQQALIALLRQSLKHSRPERVTREMLLRELEDLRAAGAFTNLESLAGKFARPGFDPSFEEIQQAIYEAATEWEDELDEFGDS